MTRLIRPLLEPKPVRPVHVPGTEADHGAIFDALQRNFYGIARDTFYRAQSDPSHRPDDWLLAKAHGRIVSHVHLTRRIMRYGSVELPGAELNWLGTLPSFRDRGIAHDLLSWAEERAHEQGLLVLFAATTHPRFFARLGWTVLGRHSFSEVPARNLPRDNEWWLLGAEEFASDARATAEAAALVRNDPDVLRALPEEIRPAGQVNVQPWRHDQRAALTQLYDSAYRHTTGSIVRDDRYWHWLLGGEPSGDVWLAQLGETPVGYALVRGTKILEIAHDRSAPQALDALLARIRIEAMDRGQERMTVYAPPGHAVHAYFRHAGGRTTFAESVAGTVFMARVTDFERLLQAIVPELDRRAKHRALPLPVELGLRIDDVRCSLHLGKRSRRLDVGSCGRKRLALTPTAATWLVFGQRPLTQMEHDGQIEASNRAAGLVAEQLFAGSPVWRSPLDAAAT